ncbi:MAG: OmpA family protein [Saprospiraceae bacterium]|nr:OmpA family protein [Saprospiraceae bacterium]
MKKLFIGCFLLLFCATISFSQEEEIKDSMEVFFKLDRAILVQESTDSITAYFEKYKERILKIRVTGHTCDLGSDNYNMGLSEKRANAAFEFVKTLGEYEEKSELFFYGEKEQKYDKRDPNRRVHVLFYLEDDDQDTVITKDCAEVFVERRTYKPTKTKNSSFELDHFSTAEAMSSNNLSINDSEGRKLYFNSVVFFKASFEGSDLTAKKSVKIKLPLVNEDKGGYTFYEGQDQGGTIVWKNTGKSCTLSDGADCKTYDFDWMNSGYCACAKQRKCEEDCNPDPFSGEENPDLTASDVRYSAEKTTCKFAEGTYADLNGVTVVDDNNKDEDLDVCEQFGYGITTDDWFPNRHKMNDKKNIFVKSDATPADKTTRLYVLRSSVEDLKDPVVLVGKGHTSGYPVYKDEIAKPVDCLGPVNCEYIVYDVHSSGLYKLGEWDNDKEKPKAEQKWLLKVRLLKESRVLIGNKSTNEVYNAPNAERNGKTRVKEYSIFNCDNVGDLVVYVQNSTKKKFKLYQEAKISELKFKKKRNMYVMRRVKFKKVQDFKEAEFTKCK